MCAGAGISADKHYLFHRFAVSFAAALLQAAPVAIRSSM